MVDMVAMWNSLSRPILLLPFLYHVPIRLVIPSSGFGLVAMGLGRAYSISIRSLVYEVDIRE